ncbi:DUF2784 domain-containing protein [Candidatus Parcubacteria bacterium]|nr:DUF2784 domain-containing protein [Candidatus Parcubacteria bacterium]
MNYSFLANATAVTHALIIIAVFAGLLVSFRYKRFRPLEAGALLLVIVLWSYYGNCPMTVLEQYFRNMAGQHSHLLSTGFLPYYSAKFLNISITSRLVQRSTFFTGGVFFAASLEWLSPFMHFEIFRLRKLFKKRGKRYLTKRA